MIVYKELPENIAYNKHVARKKRRFAISIEKTFGKKVDAATVEKIIDEVRSIFPSTSFFTYDCENCGARDAFYIGNRGLGFDDTISVCSACGKIRHLGNIKMPELYPGLKKKPIDFQI